MNNVNITLNISINESGAMINGYYIPASGTTTPKACAPKFVTHPASHTGILGGNLVLNALATGTDPITYQWYKDSVAVVGAIGTSLDLSPLTESDAGAYIIKAKNSVRTVSSKIAYVAVQVPNEPPPTGALPEILSHTPNKTYEMNDGANLNVHALNATRIDWFKDGLPINDGEVGNEANLGLGPARPEIVGTYWAVLSNAFGSVRTENIVISVISKPLITENPAAQTVTEGGTATFKVKAVGNNLSYLWKRDGIELTSQTSDTFVLENVNDGDEGLYTVVVSNEYGSVESASLSYLTVEPVDTTPEQPRVKKVYGHYMGCFSAGNGAIQWHSHSGLGTMDTPGMVEKFNNPGELVAWAKNSFGGTYRNFPLYPYAAPILSVEDSARMQIKQAIRAGLDGFTFDAWAGDEGAIDVFNRMLKVIEDEDLPFELTITLDTSCLNWQNPSMLPYALQGYNVWTQAIMALLEKHRNSPKLAKRNGKLLIMGYQSVWAGIPSIEAEATRQANLGLGDYNTIYNRLRTTEEGWQIIVDAYKKIEQDVGQEIYWEFCMSGFFYGVPGVADGKLLEATKFMAKHFPAVGLFMWEGPVIDMAEAVRAAGKEWCHPMKLQYENYAWLTVSSPGADWVRGDWHYANKYSTLIQHITWNDYHETTNLAPGYNTRYAYMDMTSKYIKAWKMGKAALEASDITKDTLYIWSHKYVHGSPTFPFKSMPHDNNVIEVTTFLKAPAKLKLLNRTTIDGQTEVDLPAGISAVKYPLTKGKVFAELYRDGAVVEVLECPDEVSDRPFRPDIGKTAISTECQFHWDIDFPGTLFETFAEYGDSGNGIPNWFLQLYFGKFGEPYVGDVNSPYLDPYNTGKNIWGHYIDQTDPTMPVHP